MKDENHEIEDEIHEIKNENHEIEDEIHEIEDKKYQKYYKSILLFHLIINIELTLLIKINYF